MSIMNRKVRRAIEILVVLVALVGVSFLLVYGQEKPKELTPKPPAKAVWQMPSYMKENLQFMLDEFNRKWDDKLEFFKKELREKFSEFQSMPEDVLFDLQSGTFITRAEMARLQAEAEKKNSEVVKKK